jgi:hypothetical protein
MCDLHWSAGLCTTFHEAINFTSIEHDQGFNRDTKNDIKCGTGYWDPSTMSTMELLSGYVLLCLKQRIECSIN